MVTRTQQSRAKGQCPHCLRKVSLASRMKYAFISTRYGIRCPHCGHSIRPLKNPLSFQASFHAGALTAFVGFWGYICLIEDRFLPALWCGACLSAVAVAAVGILTVRNLEFTKD